MTPSRLHHSLSSATPLFTFYPHLNCCHLLSCTLTPPPLLSPLLFPPSSPLLLILPLPFSPTIFSLFKLLLIVFLIIFLSFLHFILFPFTPNLFCLISLLLSPHLISLTLSHPFFYHPVPPLGWGVFTTSTFGKGDFVLEYRGRLVPRECVSKKAVSEFVFDFKWKGRCWR